MIEVEEIFKKIHFKVIAHHRNLNQIQKKKEKKKRINIKKIDNQISMRTQISFQKIVL